MFRPTLFRFFVGKNRCYYSGLPRFPRASASGLFHEACTGREWRFHPPNITCHTEKSKEGRVDQKPLSNRRQEADRNFEEFNEFGRFSPA